MRKCKKIRKFNEVEVKIESGQGDDETEFSQSQIIMGENIDWKYRNQKIVNFSIFKTL